MNPIDKEEVRKMCYTETGAVRPKPECRAEIINRLILDPAIDIDIDEAENFVDATLRELNLWGEATLEELLRDDEPQP
jgi:hypothetical protein